MPEWLTIGLVLQLLTLLVLATGAFVTIRIYFRGQRDAATDEGKWKGLVDSDRNTFKEFMDRIEDEIKAIRSTMERILFRLVPNSPIDQKSPLSLTEFGETIANEIKAASWADKYANQVKDDVLDKDEYQIQDYCLVYVKNNRLDDNLERLMRRSAFTNGIDLDLVQRVFAIVLRDRLLEVMSLE